MAIVCICNFGMSGCQSPTSVCLLIHFLVDVLQHPSLPDGSFLHWHLQLVSHLQPLPHFSELQLQSVDDNEKSINQNGTFNKSK